MTTNRKLVSPKQHNFNTLFPAEHAAQASQVVKNSYNFDFLLTHKSTLYTEHQMLDRVKQLINELGRDFCFIGNQHELLLNYKEIRIDLLFYHRILRCMVAVDIKAEPFKAEFAGRMNLWLNLLNDTMKHEDENPTLGMILCTGKDDIEVEYSLKSLNNPVAVSSYELFQNLIEPKPKPATRSTATTLSQMLQRLNVL